MSGALAAKYGDPIETDETRATALLTAFGPIEGTTFHSMWDLPDDTCITLFSVAGEDTLYLLYADEPALLEHANTNYNLNGL